MDGKTQKGARSVTDGKMSQQALVEAVWQDTGTIVGHQRVEGGDEIAAVEALVARLELSGVLVTADCLHSHEKLARMIRARGGHWLFVIKGNQPTVAAKLKKLPWGQVLTGVSETGKAHGRLETRGLKVLTPAKPVLVGFWGTRQVIQLRRWTRRKPSVTAGPKISNEVFYLVSSLPADQAQPHELAAWARGHWVVEAVHHVRDRTLDEDRHTVRTRNAPMAWAIVRDTAISALRLTGHTNIAKAMRATARRPGLVMTIIARISGNRL